jgi:hypothetical protein
MMYDVLLVYAQRCIVALAASVVQRTAVNGSQPEILLGQNAHVIF